jgi:outer membrane putative beta-barrel porin/alpha-amylase
MKTARAWAGGLAWLVLALTSPLAAQEPQAEPPPPRITLERALIEQGGLLLRPGQFEIEPSVEYTFFSTRRISVSGFSILPTLIIGVLETEKAERSVLDTVLTARLGVFRNVQAEVRVPYRFTWDRLTTETAERTESNSGIGDVEAALLFQALRERGAIPDLIIGVRGKTRTGDDPFGGDPNDPPVSTGFHSVTGMMTAVKAVDPAALFASVLYTHHFGRTVRLVATDPFKTEIDPGDSFGYNLGLALALAPELAMSFRFEQRFVFETETRSPATGGRRTEVRGSTLNVGTAFVGVNWALTRNVSVDMSVGVGVTEDAPDVSLRLAVPIRFNLW